MTAAVVAATLVPLRDAPALGHLVDHRRLDAIERSIRAPRLAMGWALERVPWRLLQQAAFGVERLDETLAAHAPALEVGSSTTEPDAGNGQLVRTPRARAGEELVLASGRHRPVRAKPRADDSAGGALAADALHS